MTSGWRAHSHRLFVVAPVQRIAVAGFGKQIGSDGRFRDPGRQPARGRRARLTRDAVAAVLDQRPLLRLGQRALTLRVGMTVPHDLVAARDERCHHLRAVVVHRSVRGARHRKFQLVEEIEATPHAHAVPIIAPRKVQHVGLRCGRDQAGPSAVERMGQQGLDVITMRPEEFGAFMRAESAKWTAVVKAAGLKSE